MHVHMLEDLDLDLSRDLDQDLIMIDGNEGGIGCVGLGCLKEREIKLPTYLKCGRLVSSSRQDWHNCYQGWHCG